MTIRRKVKKAVDDNTIEVYRKVRGCNFIRIITPKDIIITKSELKKLEGKIVTIIPKGKSFMRIVANVRHKKKKII